MIVLPSMTPARRISLPCGGWLNLHEQIGTGPAFLLIHGVTDCADSFRLLLPELAGRHLVIPDLRGHGASSPGGIHDLITFSADLEAMTAQLGLGPVILVGHSMGALVAALLASRRKIAVAGLVTISGSLRPDGPSLRALIAQVDALPDPLPIAHPFMTAWYACNRPVPDAFFDRLRKSCVAMRRDDWQRCLNVLQATDLRATVRDIAVPSLVLSGLCDEIFPPPHHADLVASLSPLTSIAFDQVGHNPHWEVPGKVAKVMKSFADNRPECVMTAARA